MATEFRLNYTGSEINRKLETVDETKSSLENNYYTSTEIDTKIDEINTSLEAKADLIGGKIPIEQLPDDIGGGVTSWNDLEDRPFYDEKAFEDIFWDGNTEGILSVCGEVDMGEDGVLKVTAYKVADKALSKSNVVNATITAINFEEDNYDDYSIELSHLYDMSSNGSYFDESTWFSSITEDNTTGDFSDMFPDLTIDFPEAGIWFFSLGINDVLLYRTVSLVLEETTENIKKLDEKFIPDIFVKQTDDIFGTLLKSTDKGVANGVASLDVNGKILESQLYGRLIGMSGTGVNAEVFNTSINIAEGSHSHAEGFSTHAEGDSSHAEGNFSHAEGSYSHAEGNFSHAEGFSSHAEGYFSHAEGNFSHVQGKHNIVDTSNQYAHIVGNGEGEDYRSNAHTLDWDGNAWYKGSITSNGADYAEYFEWLDGNLNNEDRIGLLVTLDGEKIKLANNGDDILGIISGTAAILGNNYECEWNGKYLTDDFGRVQYEDVEEFYDVIVEIDEETNRPIIEKQSLGFFKHPKLNPLYDSTQEYINRSSRPEWTAVGMVGKLYVRDDGTCQVNGYVTVGENGVSTASTEKTNMRVLSRVNDNVIRVLLK